MVYIHVNELVTDLTGQEDVRTQAQFVPLVRVAHGSPEVPQTEHSAKRHEALRVVPSFGCHGSVPFQSQGSNTAATEERRRRAQAAGIAGSKPNPKINK